MSASPSGASARIGSSEVSLPTYQYACTNPECGNRFELVQSFTDPSASECPVCSGAVRKVYSGVGVVFKGSGFYRNDSRSESGGSKDKSSQDGKSNEGKDSSKESSSKEPAKAGKDSSGSSSSSSDSSSSGSSSSSSSSASSNSSSSGPSSSSSSTAGKAPASSKS